MKIKEYTVVTAQSIGSLAGFVNDRIRLGWFPLGGVSVTNNFMYMQAMVLYENEEEAPA